jgi:hypothetical protein
LYVVWHVSEPAPPHTERPLSEEDSEPPSLWPNSMMTMSLGCTALMISSKRPSRVKERELRPPMALLTTGRETEKGK